MLLIDIGNSCLKWAIADVHGLTGNTGCIYYKSGLAGKLDHAWQALPQPDQVWVSNVTGVGTADELDRWIDDHWKCNTRYASVSPAACGVINAYPDYTRLGIDRWLALIAAWHKYKSAACIIDCGTAVTIDGLNNRGEHTGGLILPGITLMQQSLAAATTLPDTMHGEICATLANNTEQAVIAGCMLAVAALAERVSADMQARCNDEIYTILTGGEAMTIGKLLAINYKHEPHLVLEGLAVYAEEHP